MECSCSQVFLKVQAQPSQACIFFCYFDFGKKKNSFFFIFQFLNQRGERESYMKIRRKEKVIDFAIFQDGKLLFQVSRVSLIDKSLIVIIFLKKYIQKMRSIQFFFIWLIWIFFWVVLGYFRVVRWFTKVFMLFFRFFF